MHRYRLLLRRHRHIVWGAAMMMIVVLVGLGLWGYAQAHRMRVTDFNSCVLAGYDPTNSDPQTCSDGHNTYAGPTSGAVASAAPSETLEPYSILVSGDSKGVYPATAQAISDQAAWASYWARVHASVSPAPPLLPVDFSSNMVLAINLGPQATGGYGIEFSGFGLGQSSANARYNVYSPTPGCQVPPGRTNPYLLLQVPKTTLPVTFIPTAKSTTGCH